MSLKGSLGMMDWRDKVDKGGVQEITEAEAEQPDGHRRGDVKPVRSGRPSFPGTFSMPFASRVSTKSPKYMGYKISFGQKVSQGR